MRIVEILVLDKMPVKHAQWSAFDRSGDPSNWHICGLLRAPKCRCRNNSWSHPPFFDALYSFFIKSPVKIIASISIWIAAKINLRQKIRWNFGIRPEIHSWSHVSGDFLDIFIRCEADGMIYRLLWYVQKVPRIEGEQVHQSRDQFCRCQVLLHKRSFRHSPVSN